VRGHNPDLVIYSDDERTQEIERIDLTKVEGGEAGLEASSRKSLCAAAP